MALLLKSAWQGYRYVFEELADPRTSSWFLVAKPYQGLALLGLYLIFVLKWGPEWMKNRHAFNLDKVLIVYNAIQIFLCARLFAGSLLNAWAFHYRWVCEPVDFSNSDHAIQIATYVYTYYLIKILDLLDTANNFSRMQTSDLMQPAICFSLALFPYAFGGHGTLIGVINSFVHVVMYGYYLLTVAMPSLKNSMWWKKYITQLQIIQFFWMVVHMGALVFKTDCAYPRWTAAIFLPQNLFMLILFVDFYIKTYVKPKSKKENGAQNGFQNGAQNGVKNEAHNVVHNGQKNGLNDLNEGNGNAKID
ncbi:hypothetical protein MSG28_007441 [Choristoneura fumiferana]|uniref:Uncharacterized protein n=1 Tax=Choristoneura fumiferana TaxID=7141 RepID=A0ACC0JXD4_CHOFU|nr:hypothetical protein MSG28_007441 [Choristoneura fumiferana]